MEMALPNSQTCIPPLQIRSVYSPPQDWNGAGGGEVERFTESVSTAYSPLSIFVSSSATIMMCEENGEGEGGGADSDFEKVKLLWGDEH